MDKFSKVMKKLFPGGQKFYKMPGVILLAVLLVIGGISEIGKAASSSGGYVPVSNNKGNVSSTSQPTAKKDSFTVKPRTSPTADSRVDATPIAGLGNSTPVKTDETVSASEAQVTQKPISKATAAPTKAPTAATAKPTVMPTRAPTPKPTAKPTPVPTSKPPKQISVTSLTSSVRRNENVSISISGEPGVTYSITVTYPSGATATADGLGDKTADSNGYVSWSWKIGGRTNPGTGRILISDGKQNISTNFTVEA